MGRHRGRARGAAPRCSPPRVRGRYCRSAYFIVTKTDGEPKFTSLADPALRQVKRISVHMNDRGLEDNMVTYIAFLTFQTLATPTPRGGR